MSSFFEDPSIKALKLRLERRSGSGNTFYSYTVGVQIFLKVLDFKGQPKDFIKTALEAGPLWVTNKLNEFVDKLIEKRVSRGSIFTYFSGIKKWLIANGVAFDRNAIELPKMMREVVDRIPTKEELGKIYEYTLSNQMKAVITILVSSGMRIGTLLNLKMKHVSFEIDKDILVFIVPLYAQKGYMSTRLEQFAYYTFGSTEARKALENYLKERKNLNDESWIIADENERQVKYMTIVARWHNLLKLTGLYVKGVARQPLHIHVLRKYFKTQLTYRGVPTILVERWMGHSSGKVEDTYFVPNMKKDLEIYKANQNALFFTKESEIEELRKKLAEIEDRTKITPKEVSDIREV